jgi:hypothetical protein
VKLILPFLFLAIYTNAQEQEERKFAIGIHAAPTYVTIHLEQQRHLKNNQYKPVTGCIAGISGQFNFSPRVALHAELNYEKTGSVFLPNYTNASDTWPCFVPIVVKIVTNTNSITLPVSLKFNFIQRNKILVFANAGTFVSYTYSNDITTYNYFGGKSGSHDTYSYKMGNNYDPGALVGLGTDIALSKRIHLTLEVRDHLNLRDIKLIKANAAGLLTGLSFQL